jgi:phosphoglucomutase
MDFLQQYEFWKTSPAFDEATHQELAALDPVRDAKQIEDRFYKELEFGTGGLRGVMGAGTNRMNQYTVGKATKGFGQYLLDRYGADDCRQRGVVVAHDTRNNSPAFAAVTARVLSGLGIKAYLFQVPAPTPELSFAVRHLGCVGGVVVTASHNPKEYNGYKAYDEYGCQLVPADANAVIDYVGRVTDFTAIDFVGDPALVEPVDLTEVYVDTVLRQQILTDGAAKANLKVVYTPLHGAGNVPVRAALAKDGFSDVTVVPEQELPDGNFSTVKSPNPEEHSALALGTQLAEKIGADIVVGTDPDSDRVGVGVRTADGFRLLTGNQTGALLMDYVLGHKDLSKLHNPAVVKTVVTSELGAEIARKQGVTVFSTLTGFKFIGEKITQFEAARAAGDAARDFTFVLGYEESYGYLVGAHARDKDAVVSSMLICEMAAAYKAQGLTLLDRMQAIYDAFGYYLDAQDSFTLQGKDGAEQIAAMMQALRDGGSPFADTALAVDFQNPVDAEPGFGQLPTSNVLKYTLTDGTWVAVRPSGTEPKIKIYYSVRSADQAAAQARLEDVRRTITAKMGL